MPLMKCNEGGKEGWKYGQSGHCWTGPEGKKNAIKQMIAIFGPDKFKKHLHSKDFIRDKEAIELAISILKEDYPAGNYSHFANVFAKSLEKIQSGTMEDNVTPYVSEKDYLNERLLDQFGKPIKKRKPDSNKINETQTEETVGKKKKINDDPAPFGLTYDHKEDTGMAETYAYVSQKERDNMDSSEFGWPEEKKYPVKDESHFHAAVKLLGRAPKEKQAMIKKNLTRIAKRRGWKLPDTWSE